MSFNNNTFINVPSPTFPTNYEKDNPHIFSLITKYYDDSTTELKPSKVTQTVLYDFNKIQGVMLKKQNGDKLI